MIFNVRIYVFFQHSLPYHKVYKHCLQKELNNDFNGTQRRHRKY